MASLHSKVCYSWILVPSLLPRVMKRRTEPIYVRILAALAITDIIVKLGHPGLSCGSMTVARLPGTYHSPHGHVDCIYRSIPLMPNGHKQDIYTLIGLAYRNPSIPVQADKEKKILCSELPGFPIIPPHVASGHNTTVVFFFVKNTPTLTFKVLRKCNLSS